MHALSRWQTDEQGAPLTNELRLFSWRYRRDDVHPSPFVLHEYLQRACIEPHVVKQQTFVTDVHVFYGGVSACRRRRRRNQRRQVEDVSRSCNFTKTTSCCSNDNIVLYTILIAKHFSAYFCSWWRQLGYWHWWLKWRPCRMFQNTYLMASSLTGSSRCAPCHSKWDRRLTNYNLKTAVVLVKKLTTICAINLALLKKSSLNF